MNTYETAKLKSLYGRRDWLFWRDVDGAEHIEPKTRDSLKSALLACGTKRNFIMLSGGIGHRVSWRMGVLMFRNARFDQSGEIQEPKQGNSRKERAMQIVPIAPKTAMQLAERARTLDGCVRLGSNSNVYEFPQGSNVAVIIGLEHPSGHVIKDKRRADELRAEIAMRTGKASG